MTYPDADDDPIGTRCRRSDAAHEALARNPPASLPKFLTDLTASDDLEVVLRVLGVAEATISAAHDALDRLEGVVR